MDESPTPKRLFRSRDDRYIAGVAAGLANYFSIDPTLVRVAFVVSLAFGGIGLLGYVALLVLMPIESSGDEPVPPIGRQRNNLMIGGTVLFGVIVLVLIVTGGFANWIFGFSPGPLFGILLWSAALIALIWLAVKALSSNSAADGPTRGHETAPSDQGPVAASPSQTAPTTVLAATDRPTEPVTDDDDPTDAMAVAGSVPHQPNSAAATAGKVMTVIAVGITALIGLSLLALIATWTTAQFGAAPMALLIVALGGGMVLAGVSGRRQLSIWLLAAALTVALPMSVITLAGLRIDGHYGSVNETPNLASDIPADGYSLAAGRMVVDLRKLPFHRNRTVDLKVNSGLGLTSVVVPDRVCVAGLVTGGAGLNDIRGREISGVDLSREFRPASVQAPRLKLDADFKLGMLEVVDATDWRKSGGGQSRSFDDDRPGITNRTASRKRADDACMAWKKPERKRNRN